MMSFQKLPFLLLVIVSAILCRPYEDLDYTQNSALLAGGTSAVSDGFAQGIQKREATPAVTGETPPVSTDQTPAATAKNDPKNLSKGLGNKSTKTPSPNANENDRDPKEKLQERIKKYKSQIKNLKEKLARDEAKLKAMFNGTSDPNLPKIPKEKDSNLDGSKGGNKNSNGNGSKGEKQTPKNDESKGANQSQLGGSSRGNSVKTLLKDNKVATPSLDVNENKNKNSKNPVKTTVDIPATA